MSDGIYAALSGAVGQTTALDTTATNMANATTTGFRGLRPIFHEVLARASNSGKDQPLRLTEVQYTAMDMTPGTAKETGRPTDIMLSPSSYLAVETPQGERYTRAGNLHIASDGALMTASGNAVLGENGTALKVQPNAQVSISNEGQLLADGSPVGRLRIVTFTDPTMLTHEGSTLFTPMPQAGEATLSKDPITVGALEESNASPMKAMTDLMMTSRMFESFERVISTFHELDRKILTQVPTF